MPHASPTARHHAGHTQHQQHQRQPSQPLDKAEREAETCRLARIVQSSERGSAEWIAARNRIVELNLGLVWMIVDRYVTTRRLERQDMFQAGCFGLMRAAEEFDPDRGKVFATLGGIWIRRHLQVYCVEHGALIRVPWYAKNEDGSPCRPHKVMPIAEQTDRVQDHRQLDKSTDVDDADFFHAAVDLVRGDLRPEDLAVITLRYGLDGQEPLTVREIGERTGMSYQGAQQRIERILPRLRKRLKPLLDQLEEVA